MSGAELFGRTSQVIVAPVDGSDGIDVTGLRVEFEVEKTRTSEPNTATVRVYNLSPYSRNRIESKDQFVILKAGYTDLVASVVTGGIKRVEHRREGVNIITEIEIKDGGQDLLEPEFRRAYSRGTSRRKIINDIIGSMPNTSMGAIRSSAINGSTSAKLALSTTCKLALDRLSRAWGFEWSVQSGAVNILDTGVALEASSDATVISPETGLLGSPTRTGQEGEIGLSTRSRKDRRGARFETLLSPSLIPGSLIQLKSDFVSGFFKVQSVEHRGDTHGNSWNSVFETVQL